jgi:hypothetical protein
VIMRTTQEWFVSIDTKAAEVRFLRPVRYRRSRRRELIPEWQPRPKKQEPPKLAALTF